MKPLTDDAPGSSDCAARPLRPEQVRLALLLEPTSCPDCRKAVPRLFLLPYGSGSGTAHVCLDCLRARERAALVRAYREAVPLHVRALRYLERTGATGG